MRTARCAAASTRSSPRSLSATSLARLGPPPFIALVSLAFVFLGARAAVTVRDADISDFRCFYEAARVVRLGLDPYDRAVWSAATMSDPTRLPPCDPTFVYPLWTAAAMIPFSIPPEPLALALWEAMSLVLLVAATALMARAWSSPRIGPPLL